MKSFCSKSAIIGVLSVLLVLSLSSFNSELPLVKCSGLGVMNEDGSVYAMIDPELGFAMFDSNHTPTIRMKTEHDMSGGVLGGC